MAEETNAAAENTNTEVSNAGEETTNVTNTEATTEKVAEPSTILGSEEKAAEPTEKEGEAEPAKQIPESYDFSSIVPEGTELDEKEVQEFSNIAKDLGLSQEQADKLANYGFSYLGRGISAYEAQRQAEVNSWGETARKELGTDFDNTMVTCGKAIEAVEKQVPGIRAALNATGAGNRIEIIRAFKILGEALQEDPGKGIGGGGIAPDTTATWYNNSDMK